MLMPVQYLNDEEYVYTAWEIYLAIYLYRPVSTTHQLRV